MGQEIDETKEFTVEILAEPKESEEGSEEDIDYEIEHPSNAPTPIQNQYVRMTNHQVIDGVQHPHPPVRQMNHQYSDLNLDDSKEEYKDTDLTSEVYEDQPALYTIDFDKETGLLIASLNRDIEQYLPELNESTNFRMFVYSRSYEEQDRQDSEMVMEIATFLTLIQTAQIDFDEDYVLMRWNSGFDAWAASKFNKHKAKTFLKSF